MGNSFFLSNNKIFRRKNNYNNIIEFVKFSFILLLVKDKRPITISTYILCIVYIQVLYIYCCNLIYFIKFVKSTQ